MAALLLSLFPSFAAADCAAAWNSFTSVNSTCGNVLSLWSADAATVSDAVPTWCPNCQTNLTAAITDVLAQCQTDTRLTSNAANVLLLRYLSNAVCNTNNTGGNCFVAFKTAQSAIATNVANALTTVTDWCGQCLTQQYTLAATYGTPAILGVVDQVHGYCLAVKEVWCAPIFAAAWTTFKGLGAGVPSAANLDILCPRCVRIIARRQATMAAWAGGAVPTDISSLLSSIDKYCAKNGVDYCISSLSQQQSLVNSAQSSCSALPQGTCSSSCKSALSSLSGKATCCFGTFATQAVNNGSVAVFDAISSGCSLSTQLSCAAQATKLYLWISGVQPSWATANPSAFATAVRDGLSWWLGENGGRIWVNKTTVSQRAPPTGSSGAGPYVYVEVFMLATEDAQANPILTWYGELDTTGQDALLIVPTAAQTAIGVNPVIATEPSFGELTSTPVFVTSGASIGTVSLLAIVIAALCLL